jgi:RNA polymerase sigma factor (sigma-70 family)
VDGDQEPASRFEQHRPHLRTAAYRMLGSLAEAGDAVQDTWPRLSRSGADGVDIFGGWLTTIVARLCLNMLRTRTRTRRHRREVHVPDPVLSVDGHPQPEEQAMIADLVGLALLIVLEALSPDERLAFVLHDQFGLPFTEIGPLLGRTPAAAKQLAGRARRRVRGAETPPAPGLGRRREVVDAFFAAAREGNLDALVAVLHPTSCHGWTPARGHRHRRDHRPGTRRRPGRPGRRGPTARCCSPAGLSGPVRMDDPYV